MWRASFARLPMACSTTPSDRQSASMADFKFALCSSVVRGLGQARGVGDTVFEIMLQELPLQRRHRTVECFGGRDRFTQIAMLHDECLNCTLDPLAQGRDLFDAAQQFVVQVLQRYTAHAIENAILLPTA